MLDRHVELAEENNVNLGLSKQQRKKLKNANDIKNELSELQATSKRMAGRSPLSQVVVQGSRRSRTQVKYVFEDKVEDEGGSSSADEESSGSFANDE